MKKIIIMLTLLYSTYLFSQNVTNPKDILAFTDSITLKNHPNIEKTINYPPDCTVIRVFKQERVCEIWSKDSSQDSLSLILTIPICSMDFKPGPKLRNGDSKTPEGFYYGDFAYYSSQWFMWMDLNNVEKSGQVGKGSAFRICLNYPNQIDQRHSSMAGFSNTGGAICVHGNCVSIGCVSFQNKNFVPVYAFSRHHDSSKYGKVQYHIFPFKSAEKTESEVTEYSKDFIHHEEYTPDKLRGFWKNLAFGEKLFNEHKMPLTIITNRRYLQEDDLSETIKTVKEFLKEKGFYSSEINCVFDSVLKSAVIQYQNENNMTADGLIGNNTLSHMRKDGLEDFSIEYIFRVDK